MVALRKPLRNALERRDHTCEENLATVSFALTSKTISWKYTKLLRFFKDTDTREEVKGRKLC